MATITPTVSVLAGNVLLITWSNMAADDVGSPVRMLDYQDSTIEFSGTFGGATAIWEGGNAASVYSTLTDALGDPISKAAQGISWVTEDCQYVRPRISGGAGVAINANLFAVRKSYTPGVFNISPL